VLLARVWGRRCSVPACIAACAACSAQWCSLRGRLRACVWHVLRPVCAPRTVLRLTNSLSRERRTSFCAQWQQREFDALSESLTLICGWPSGRERVGYPIALRVSSVGIVTKMNERGHVASETRAPVPSVERGGSRASSPNSDSVPRCRQRAEGRGCDGSPIGACLPYIEARLAHACMLACWVNSCTIIVYGLLHVGTVRTCMGLRDCCPVL